MAKLIINEDGFFKITKIDSYASTLQGQSSGSVVLDISSDNFNDVQDSLKTPSYSDGTVTYSTHAAKSDSSIPSEAALQAAIDHLKSTMEEWKNAHDSNDGMYSNVSSFITSLGSVDISDLSYPISGKILNDVLSDKSITPISILEI